MKKAATGTSNGRLKPTAFHRHRARGGNRLGATGAAAVMACAAAAVGAEPAMHEIISPRQIGPPRVYVLAPDNIEPGKKYPALYMLPVEAEDNAHFGNPLEEARALDLANRHQIFCVYPTFTETPWFADHPTDLKKRQESYFIQEAIPFVEANYPVLSERSGRWLAGFSKSGWGAFSLLLRNPGLFEKAASFDAPLMQEKVGPWGSGLIFGDQQTFDAHRPDLLFRKHAAEYRGGSPRFVLMGSVLFKKHTGDAHALMLELGIPHLYHDVQSRRHHWNSDWLDKAAQMLFGANNNPALVFPKP